MKVKEKGCTLDNHSFYIEDFEPIGEHRLPKAGEFIEDGKGGITKALFDYKFRPVSIYRIKK